MKRLIVYIITVFFVFGCSSKKILSVKKTIYNENINHISSQYEFNQKSYNGNDNLKNSSVQNQEEDYSNLTSHNDNQKILASKEIFEPDFLTKRNNSQNPPTIIQCNRFNKLFIDKPQIFENKKSSLKETNNKEKIKKILKIIGVSILITITAFISLFTVVLIAETKFNASSFLGEYGFPLILISSTLIYCSFKSIKKVRESNLKEKNKN